MKIFTKLEKLYLIMTKINLKKGDEIIIIEARNMSKKFEGSICEITSQSGNKNNSFQARVKNCGTNVTIYHSGPADVYIEATKETKKEYYKDKLKEVEEELRRIKSEIEFLEKYDSMEEFVADKIGLLVQANTKESRVAILKTLKQTNYL